MARRRRTIRRATGPATPGRLSPLLFWSALAVIVASGAVLRILAARGELWLDEIWSLRLAQSVSNRAGILTELHHDNNHHLNTLYLSWLGEPPVWLLYRLHTLAAGLGTVVLAAFVARRAGDWAALTAALFTSSSFLLILYSSEARGYSLAVFCALLAIVLADRALSTGRLSWALGFGLACAAGVLSHLSFLHAYAGLLAWTGYRCLTTPRGRQLGHLAALHLVPLACLAVLYWIDLRYVRLGGGPPFTVAETVSRALSLAVGGPATRGHHLTAVVAMLAFIVSIRAVRRSGSDMWVLFAGTVVAPAVMLATVDTRVLFERYFLVAIALCLLSASWLGAVVADRSRLAWALLVSLFVVGNTVHTWRLLDRGRGSYIAVMNHMTAETRRMPVTVGGDHDLRHGRVIEFYQPFVPGGDRMTYQRRQEWSPAGPEWVLLHSQEEPFVPASEITVEGGRRYRLSQVYRSGLLSGWHVAVYRNETGATR